MQNHSLSSSCGVFLDLRKAFDSVSRSGLLEKLYSLDLPPNLCSWLYSYLSGRSQRVRIGTSPLILYQFHLEFHKVQSLVLFSSSFSSMTLPLFLSPLLPNCSSMLMTSCSSTPSSVPPILLQSILICRLSPPGYHKNPSVST